MIGMRFMKISQIKKVSRKIIKGNVLKSSKLLMLFAGGFVLFSALPFAVELYFKENRTTVLSILAAVFILNIISLSSFRTGSRAWFLLYNRKKRGAKTVYWFRLSKALKSTGLYISLFIKKLIWTAAFVSPGAVMISAAVIIAMNGGMEFNIFASWIIGGAVLAVTGMIFLGIFKQRFFLVPYLKAADPTMKNREIFRKSRTLMNMNLKKAAMLKISFLPWLLICVTVVPSAYVWAYYSQSCAVMADEIIKSQKEKAVQNEHCTA